MQFEPHAVMTEGARPSFERAIDLVHLARQTLGDRDLEREVLDLFVTQARTILDRLQASPDLRARSDLAHTLKGSARSVGAWRVAAEAESCEQLVEAADASWQGALDRLTGEVRAAVGAIHELGYAA